MSYYLPPRTFRSQWAQEEYDRARDRYQKVEDHITGRVRNCSVNFSQQWYTEFLFEASTEELDGDYCNSGTMAKIRENLNLTG